jgi:hypothetical protein
MWVNGNDPFEGRVVHVHTMDMEGMWVLLERLAGDNMALLPLVRASCLGGEWRVVAAGGVPIPPNFGQAEGKEYSINT